MDRVTGLLFEPSNEPSVVNIDNTLDSLHDLLSCSCIGITSRLIGGHRFYIVYDDEALLKNTYFLTSIYRDGSPAFYGKILVVNFDGIDDICSLTDYDISYLNFYTSYDILVCD